MRRAILLFLKYPEPGKVKTRLAATVGAVEAVAIYRRLVAEVCLRLPTSGVNILVMFDPPERLGEVVQWIGELLPGTRGQYIPQTSGDLGARLQHAFETAFAAGYDQIAVIGSDCVEITPEIFHETWRMLEHSDVVIGPTGDGGYYLLALRTHRPELFEEIQWSTEVVLAQTLERAERAGLCVSLLPEHDDVDTEDDWQRAESRLKP